MLVVARVLLPRPLEADGAAEAAREGVHGGSGRQLVAVARVLNPTAAIVVRTAGAADVGPLVEDGADQVIAEETESIVQLFARVLDGYLVSREEADRPSHRAVAGTGRDVGLVLRG